MSALQPCDACLRHVRSSDPACPFCGARVEARAPRPWSGATRLHIFLGALTLGASGVEACAEPSGPRTAMLPYGLPAGYPMPQRVPVELPADGGAPSDGGP